MSLQVIGAGLGRTGTYSMKAALEQLGFGPCYHMIEVLQNPAQRLPQLQAAMRGEPNWDDLFDGYNSTVDWPSAAFWRELIVTYPHAKVVLTTRSTDSWVASFSETIYKLMAGRDQVPPVMLPFIDNSIAVTTRSGFPSGLNLDGLARAYDAHIDAVTAALPEDKLLVFDVKQGWRPLCTFLGKPVPSQPFPVSNNRTEFWEHVRSEN